jgi:hypothetical protein
MAHAATDFFSTSRRPSHDGMLRCVICRDGHPGSDHDWCPAVECLLCEDCCGKLLDGDPVKILSIMTMTDRLITPEHLAQACASCPRAVRHFTQRAFDLDDEDERPLLC